MLASQSKNLDIVRYGIPESDGMPVGNHGLVSIGYAGCRKLTDSSHRATATGPLGLIN